VPLTMLETLVEIAAGLLLLPVTVLFVEVVSASVLRSPAKEPRGERRRVAVLMPAYNESSLIALTLESIRPQLESSDRLVVIADNCTDDTAAIAAGAGAESIVRTDPARRGKGFALDFGVHHLVQSPPEVVIVVDADCRVAPGAIDTLARKCDSSGRPIQALYLMRAPAGSGIKTQTAEFAWAVKNLVRPTGLHRLGMPCHLTGSGMAFPWSVIRTATLATSHIVEDLKLGIDLARTGTAPVFCAEALVTSEFPLSSAGAASQRTRWEHGHLSVILSEVPGLAWDSLTRFDPMLLALAFDVMVPPLALLTLLVGAVWAAACVALVLTKALLPIAMASLAVLLLTASVLLAWAVYGRNIVSLHKLAFAAIYAPLKLPLYLKFLFTRQSAWIRSRRDDED
jgi:cellulose synthase/poly-beta-1,6-N-acetylglucosamine synthase-like glycosyltransferase